MSPALAGGFFATSATWEAQFSAFSKPQTLLQWGGVPQAARSASQLSSAALALSKSQAEAHPTGHLRDYAL